METSYCRESSAREWRADLSMHTGGSGRQGPAGAGEEAGAKTGSPRTSELDDGAGLARDNRKSETTRSVGLSHPESGRAPLVPTVLGPEPRPVPSTPSRSPSEEPLPSPAPCRSTLGPSLAFLTAIDGVWNVPQGPRVPGFVPAWATERWRNLGRWGLGGGLRCPAGGLPKGFWTWTLAVSLSLCSQREVSSVLLPRWAAAGPKVTGPTHHGLTPRKPWAKINPSS